MLAGPTYCTQGGTTLAAIMRSRLIFVLLLFQHQTRVEHVLNFFNFRPGIKHHNHVKSLPGSSSVFAIEPLLAIFVAMISAYVFRAQRPVSRMKSWHSSRRRSGNGVELDCGGPEIPSVLPFWSYFSVGGNTVWPCFRSKFDGGFCARHPCWRYCFAQLAWPTITDPAASTTALSASSTVIAAGQSLIFTANGYRTSALAFVRSVEPRILQVPGVQSLAWESIAPFNVAPISEIRLDNQSKGQGRPASVDNVSADFF